jgi:hypothetical protein
MLYTEYLASSYAVNGHIYIFTFPRVPRYIHGTGHFTVDNLGFCLHTLLLALQEYGFLMYMCSASYIVVVMISLQHGLANPYIYSMLNWQVH